MATDHRELLLTLLRNNPALAAELLKCVRPDLVPAFGVTRLEPPLICEIGPVCDQPDAVVTFAGEGPAEDGEYKSDCARGHFGDDEVEGAAEMLLTVIEARGIAVSQEVRTRLDECDDLEQLMDWGGRAAIAESIEDVFG